jgi:hypothetical protein
MLLPPSIYQSVQHRRIPSPASADGHNTRALAVCALARTPDDALRNIGAGVRRDAEQFGKRVSVSVMQKVYNNCKMQNGLPGRGRLSGQRRGCNRAQNEIRLAGGTVGRVTDEE